MNATPQQFLYKVWTPGTAPTSSEPLLTLHSSTAVHFFVESVLSGNSLFTDKPFAMCAYHIVHELAERQVAEGTYRLQNEDAPRLITVYEAGMLANYGGCAVTCAALIDAVATITKEQQIL